jgi:hypothetical protein
MGKILRTKGLLGNSSWKMVLIRIRIRKTLKESPRETRMKRVKTTTTRIAEKLVKAKKS